MVESRRKVGGLALRLLLFAFVALLFTLVARETFAVEATPHVEKELAADGGNLFTMKRWSPYVVGVGIGILSWLTFLFSGSSIGVSTAYARTAGMVEERLIGKRATEKDYYQEYEPKVDWQWMLVLGVLIGATLSAVLSGDFRWEITPPLWKAAFGDTPVARLVVALAGGWLIGFGSRWAGGCTSGHGISGTLQLALSGWLAAICFFVGGIVAALILLRVIG